MVARRFAFGPFLLNSENGTLLRDGEPVAVGGRGVHLLEALLQRPGEVVTKAELLDAAWPEMTVEESNLSVQIALLRKALSPSPDGRDWIATVARIGYRFVGPTAPKTQPDTTQAIPSLAVLPFANLSNDPEQEFFADGLAEEIITTLSKLSGLRVIARGVSFSYKGRVADPRHVARDLAVRYALEGSVRKSGNRIRMAVSLVDAETGGHAWADRYDRELADIFAIQDEVTGRIVEALRVVLRPTETPALGRARTKDIEALGWVLRARALQRGPVQSADVFRQASALLRRAIERDPAYAEAYGGLAIAHVVDFLNNWSGNRERAIAQARLLADDGIQRDLHNPFVHFAAGLAAMFSRDLERAASEVETALALNPNDGQAINLRGVLHFYSGDPQSAMTDIERAMHLDPTFGHLHLHNLGMAHLVAGDYETAASLFRERIVEFPRTDMTRAYLAAALGHLGEVEEARRILGELREISPDYSPFERLALLPFKNPADADRIAEGLRKAGVTG